MNQRYGQWLTLGFLMVTSLVNVALAETTIRLTAGKTVIEATLNDSAASQDFIKSLPRTMNMTRWGNREYYGKVLHRLSVKGEKQNFFKSGDVAYWAPGGSFAIFFNDRNVDTSINDLLLMGKITSDLKAFDTLGESVDMHIEVLK